MRRASRVLCLTGSILALALGVSVLFGAAQFYLPPLSSPDTANVLLGMGIAAALAAALGAACLTALKNRAGLSAAMMFAAALLSLPVVIPFLVLVPAGILALLREKPPGERKPVRQPQDYPYNAYPPAEYPPQGYPPQGWPQGYPPQGWPCQPGQNAPNDTNKEGQ